MNTGFHVLPTDLRDYAKALGWIQKPEALNDRLYVLTNPRFARRQLVFPADTSAPDYTESVWIVAHKLAELEEQPLERILNALREIKDDTLRFEILSDRNSTAALPLPFAAAAVKGAQHLLLAAACTVLRPRTHHPRLSRGEAQQLIEKSEFRHTEHGSFVLRVSCPVDALDVQGELLVGEISAPFVRKTMITLARSLGALVTSIEADTVPKLIEDTKSAENPLISSNFCDALALFRDNSLDNSLDISISWAASKPLLHTEPLSKPFRLQPDYFPRIEEVARELRSTEAHREDVFIGTVESLNGDMGNDGRRAGEVTLALLLKEESEIVRAKVNLTADQYANADKAHMTEGAYVRVTGRLHPGRQPRSLTDISQFELLTS
jgi:hypothetical protein